MALMPTMEDTRKPVALRIPGVTDVGPIVQPPVMPTGTPSPTAPTPSVAAVPPVAPAAVSTGRAATSTTTTSRAGGQQSQLFTGTGAEGEPAWANLANYRIQDFSVSANPPGAPSRPPNPTVNWVYRGPGGVIYIWRPARNGWFRLGPAPSPTEAGVTTGQPATTPPATPPATGTPAPDAGAASGGGGVTPTPTPWTPDPNWWWQQFAGTGDYQMTAPQIAAQENQTAQQFGYQIRRDTTAGAPTYGQAFYRPRGTAAGTGTILAYLVPVPGTVPPQAKYVYRDSSGTEYRPEDLEMDVVALRPGEAGYREGSLGRTRMESEARQAGLGSAFAERGLRRSGIRGTAAAAGVQSLLDALSALSREAGTQFTGTQNRWMELFNRIYPGLAESAQGLYEASIAPPPGAGGGDGGAGGGGEAAPEVPAAPTAPQTGPSFEAPNGMTYGVGDQIAAGPSGVGMFSQKGTPGGTLPRSPKPRELFRGSGGVWWAWRPDGPQGAGWYKFVPAAPGAPSPTQAGVTTRT